VAKDFLDDAVNRNGNAPHTIHADRGGAMISKPVSELSSTSVSSAPIPAPVRRMTTRIRKRNLKP
jgi:hypothetical protein